MPSVFPELYNYSHFAPFLLRLAVGVFFIISGFNGLFIKKIQTKISSIIPKIINGLELVSGILLLVGLFVQPVAIAAAVLLVAAMIFKNKLEFGGTYDQRGLRFILIAVLLSLIVLGPGMFSFDLSL